MNKYVVIIKREELSLLASPIIPQEHCPLSHFVLLRTCSDIKGTLLNYTLTTIKLLDTAKRLTKYVGPQGEHVQ